VLVRQNTSQVQEDAVRMLLVGRWDCTGIASEINIGMKTNYQAGGSLQSTLHLISDGMDLSVDVVGRWMLKGFNLQQTYTSVGDLTGKLNDEPITPAANSQLKTAILGLSPDPEAINISDQKFTLTDGEGTVTTCTR
jgi:hypothetical protein